MEINIILDLILVALIGFGRLHIRYDRVLSWLMCVFTLYLFINYSALAHNSENVAFSFVWNQTRLGDITVDFCPSVTMNKIISSLFFILVMAILNNNIFRYEERRSSFNSYMILNFISLCLIITAQNYIQLLTAIFFSDILGYMILKDVDSSHRYVIYNFFADMCLFMVLSLVCGKLQSLELNHLLSYKQIGRHKDFVSIVTLMAISIKLGCFLFSGYLTDLSAVRFQRMSMIDLLFSPLVGILLLVKLHNLLLISETVLPIYNAIAFLTILAGMANFLIKDNIQKKLINLNMGFWGLLMYMLKTNNFNWSNNFSYYFLGMFFFNVLFFKIYLYQNREQNVSHMLNSQILNTLSLKIILIQIVMLASIFFTLSQYISIELQSTVPLYCITAILFEICIVLSHIYKSPHTLRLDYLNPNSLRILSFIINFMLLLIGLYYFRQNIWHSLLFIIIFLSITALPIWYHLRKIYENKFLQVSDLGNSIFSYSLVKPLRYISRNLWLTVDMMLSEKVTVTIFNVINKTILSIFFKLNKKDIVFYLFFIILGIIVFIVAFYRRSSL